MEGPPVNLLLLTQTAHLLAIVAATNAVADQDGPAAERTGGITGGPTIQHAGTRLARASTAFMHDKCTKEFVLFRNQTNCSELVVQYKYLIL